MAKFILSPRAEDDIRDIWHHIYRESPKSADALLARIYEKIERAAEYPFIGSPRTEIGLAARILVEGNYIIIYNPTDYGVFIVAIVYGSRNPEEWL